MIDEFIGYASVLGLISVVIFIAAIAAYSPSESEYVGEVTYFELTGDYQCKVKTAAGYWYYVGYDRNCDRVDTTGDWGVYRNEAGGDVFLRFNSSG